MSLRAAIVRSVCAWLSRADGRCPRSSAPRCWFLAAVAATALPCLAPALGARSVPNHLVLNHDGARLGAAVALDGDVAVIGAPSFSTPGGIERGAAAVYVWTSDGWTLEQLITASDGAPADRFGTAVSVSGDTIVVGAPGADLPGGPDAGCAYVFVRSHSSGLWEETSKLSAVAPGAGDAFGSSVAVSVNSLIVGAPLADAPGAVDRGAARIFERAVAQSAWVHVATLQMSGGSGAAGDNFGASVAISGGTAVVGAPHDDGVAGADQGSAHVFVRSETTGAWSLEQSLTLLSPMAGALYGRAVAIDADTVVVGAFDQPPPSVHRGGVYIFRRTGGTWAEHSRESPAQFTTGEDFGAAVSMSRSTLVVGAPGIGGGAYVFSVDDGPFGSVTQDAKLTCVGESPADGFGAAVGVYGDSVFVGAPGEDGLLTVDAGGAWAFSRADHKWIGPDQLHVASDGADGDMHGIAVSVHGEIAVVGSPGDDLGANANQGSVRVYVREGTGWRESATLKATDGASGDAFGSSVAVGNGGAFIVVGAPLDDVSFSTDQGSVYVFVPIGPNAWSQHTKLTANDGGAGDNFGAAVGVGLSGTDIIVGAPLDNVGINGDQGSAYVFTQSSGTYTQQARLTASDGEGNDRFGAAVDLDGNTAIVGAPLDNVGAAADQGSAYAFTRSGTTWTQQAHLVAGDGEADDRFGTSVALGGDTAAVGSPFDDGDEAADKGSAYAYTRSGALWIEHPPLSADDGEAGSRFGASVAVEPASDFTVGSIVVGAPMTPGPGAVSAGAAYVFKPIAGVWARHAKLSPPEAGENQHFGAAASVALDTVFIGAPGHEIFDSAVGAAHSLDLPQCDLSAAHNSTLGAFSDSLPSLLDSAQAGDVIEATGASFRHGFEFGDCALFSRGAVRVPFGQTVNVQGGSGSTLLSAAPGRPIELFGDVTSSGTPVFSGAELRLGARGVLTASGPMSIAGQTAEICGRLTIHGAELASGVWVLNGSVTDAGSHGRLAATDRVTNNRVLSLSGGAAIPSGVDAPLFVNNGLFELSGSSAEVTGECRNEAYARIDIQSGDLRVLGSLDNRGEIIAAECDGCTGGPPRLEVDGRIVHAAGATLIMPIESSIVAGSDFDCAISDHTRFDMLSARVVMSSVGPAPERTIEALSRDIGPAPTGLTRAAPGNLPIGALRIGPSPTTVRLVDARDNDGLGQSQCEALYVRELLIDAGSHLITGSCRVYYRTLVLGGTVDNPAHLVAIGGPCSTDFDGNGTTDASDIFVFLDSWFTHNGQPGPALEADYDGSGTVDATDIFQFLDAWFANNGQAC